MGGQGRPIRAVRSRALIRFAQASLLLALGLLLGGLQAADILAGDATGEVTGPDAVAERLIAQGTCPCGCGSQLPGSGHANACFGCSVGKAEVTFIRESLARGRPLSEILMALRELVLVEVFADYTDRSLSEVWRRARSAADELGQHRVVLRVPGSSSEALRALAVAECTRGSGRFTRVQAALIVHAGPWEEARLVDLAWGVLAAEIEANPGPGVWTRDALQHCVANIDLGAQVERDRRHASERAMQSFPAVAVNGDAVPDTLESMRRAIRAALQQGSI